MKTKQFRVWTLVVAVGIALFGCGGSHETGDGGNLVNDLGDRPGDGADGPTDLGGDSSGCVPSNSVETFCTGGVDEDCDGLVDCADPDCVADPACATCTPRPEVCTDGIDNDCDGLTDCNDPDCASTCTDPCLRAMYGDGAYCGTSLGAGSANTLYQCVGRATASSTPCANGCVVEPPGVNDMCASGDPCSHATLGNGAYCGSSLGAGDPNTLYWCTGTTTSSSMVCASGCIMEPPGVNDMCAGGTDPCSRATLGDGGYCGSSLGAGDPNTLYWCVGRVTSSATVCTYGCIREPAGTNDMCGTGTDPCTRATLGDGGYCGSSLGAGDPNTLYWCIGGATSSSTVCASGCIMEPPGVNDRCGVAGGCCLSLPTVRVNRGFDGCGGGSTHFGIDYNYASGSPLYASISGTVVGTRTGDPNCWGSGTCSWAPGLSCTCSCLNSFNYVEIRSDCGDPADSSRGLFVWYVHISSLAAGISTGVHVDVGQLIAYSGNSGCSSGPHLHLETVSLPAGTMSYYLSTCNSVDPNSRACP